MTVKEKENRSLQLHLWPLPWWTTTPSPSFQPCSLLVATLCWRPCRTGGGSGAGSRPVALQ
eukprot:1686356-Pyramimonas_sp.AAC.1